jgi:hypothetical protein
MTMEEKSGLIIGVQVLMVKTAPDIIDAIALRTGIETSKVKAMMRYNVFTISQYIDLSGMAESTIRNKIRPTKMDKASGKWVTELNFCYPHPNKDGESPLFIFRDEKSEKHIIPQP